MRYILLLIALFTFSSIATGQNEAFTLKHDGVVTAAAWNPDESRILTTAEDDRLRIWDATTGKQLAEIEHDSPVRGGLWNQAGDQILTWTQAGTVTIWDVDTLDARHQVTHEDNVLGTTWSVDETQVLSWSMDSTAQLWSPTDGQVVELPHESPVLMAVIGEDTILTYEENSTMHIWSLDGEPIDQQTLRQTVLGVTWSADMTQLAAWTVNGEIYILDMTQRQQQASFNHRSFVEGAAWNQDQSQLLSWSADDTAQVWDTRSGNARLSLHHNDWVNGAHWNADESRILTWSHTQVWLWDDTGNLIVQLPHDNLVNGAIWNANESQILSWGWDNAARVWNLDD